MCNLNIQSYYTKLYHNILYMELHGLISSTCRVIVVKFRLNNAKQTKKQDKKKPQNFRGTNQLCLQFALFI